MNELEEIIEWFEGRQDSCLKMAANYAKSKGLPSNFERNKLTEAKKLDKWIKFLKALKNE